MTLCESLPDNSYSTLMVQDVMGTYQPASHEAIIEAAQGILREQMRHAGLEMTNPKVVKAYLQCRMARLDHEVCWVLFLDSQYRLIEDQQMFRRTLSQASVYPREIVKESLRLNAAAIIMSHNHPSGCKEASRADIALTKHLKQALALVDVNLLDHIIVAGDSTVSLAESGLV
ncbi:DNA repair protein RadC [Candidimonas humi]|nr:DNA repair protein RadC [Candidimonas humi]